MNQVLEYITQNYTLFLVGAIVILLAVIGYYADKTNFGQRKSNENEDNKDLKKIEDADFEEPKESVIPETLLEEDNKEQLEYETKKSEEIQNKELNDIESTNDDVLTHVPQLNKEDNNVYDNLIVPEQSMVVDDKQDNKLFDTNLVLDNKVVTEKNDTSLLNEEVFNRFNEEFNSILPEKEFINTDLLSDIADLELDKTQKIDLGSVPDLDDIQLPKIKQLTSDDEDIWKF